MKPFLLLLITVSSACICRAQVLLSSAGSDLTIKSGTTFTLDRLTLTPSADFTISNNTITKATTVIHNTVNNYITRVYQFTNNSNTFSGTLQFGYSDGTELNGIPENALVINNHNGSSWSAYSSPSRDNSDNFIQNTGLSSIQFNELTLSSEFSTLPLRWVSFTATLRDSYVWLNWETAAESGIHEYYIEHSRDGLHWNRIGTIPVLGNMQSGKYRFTDTRPLSGLNHYRIVINEPGAALAYSQSKTVSLQPSDADFTLRSNVVTDGQLRYQANTPIVLFIYQADGRKIACYAATTGWQTADLSRYGKGVYYIRSSNHIRSFIIQ